MGAGSGVSASWDVSPANEDAEVGAEVVVSPAALDAIVGADVGAALEQKSTSVVADYGSKKCKSIKMEGGQSSLARSVNRAFEILATHTGTCAYDYD